MKSPGDLGLKSSCLFLALITAVTLWRNGEAQVNRKIGVQFLSYVNLRGQVANGRCCDGQTLPSGDCMPDSCDTAFIFCFRHHSNASTCDPKATETATIMNNNTVNPFGKLFGGDFGNGTSSLLVLPVTTMENILIEIEVMEVTPPYTRSLMGNFSLLVNTTHLFTNDPDWDTYNFDNNVIRLSLNVTSFCSPRYYSAQGCDTYCDPRMGHFTCDNDGQKTCEQGWEGPATNCKTMTDLCVSSPCANGATCSPLLNDFSCHCAPGFTGKLCDTVLPSTTTATSAPSTPPTTSSISRSSTTTSSTSPTTTTSAQSTSASVQRFQKPPKDEGSGTSIGVILGPLFGVLLLGAASVVAFIYFQRKRKRTVAPEDEAAEKEQPEIIGDKVEPQTAPVSTGKEGSQTAPLPNNQNTTDMHATQLNF